MPILPLTAASSSLNSTSFASSLGVDAVGVGGMGGMHCQLLYSSGARSTAPAAAQRWTDEQSTKLRELVNESGPKDWTNIAKKVGEGWGVGERGNERASIKKKKVSCMGFSSICFFAPHTMC